MSKGVITLNAALPQSPDALTVDVAGAAKLLAISVSHLYALIKTGRFGPSPVLLGRSCRFRVAELIDWVNAGCPDRVRWKNMRGSRR